ncbi:MAG: CYTH domain-containing protein [Cyclobacteriaceae bacterium]|nr:CYTH domain-containing protein [Cyclobacteriaceae bacterium]
MQPLDYKDYTLKARITELDRFHERLKELSATFVGTDHQRDHYFATNRGKLKWRQGTIENLITHYERIAEKGAERTIVYRYDLHPTPEDVEQLQGSAEFIQVIEKIRHIYLIGHIKIHLDQLPSGDQFIEIEAIDRANQFSHAELMRQCLELQQKLDIPSENRIPTGYFSI